jgi:hypothetical protein
VLIRDARFLQLSFALSMVKAKHHAASYRVEQADERNQQSRHRPYDFDQGSPRKSTDKRAREN